MSGPTVCHITTAHDALDPRIYEKECRTLAAAGYHTVLIAPHPVAEIRDGVEIRAIPRARSRLRRVLHSQLAVLRQLRGLNTARLILHVHDPELLPLAYGLSLLGARVIFDVHEDVRQQILVKGYLPLRLRSTIANVYGRIEGVLVKRFATVHVTESIADKYKGRKALVRNFPHRPDLPLGGYYEDNPNCEIPRLVYVGAVSRLRGALTMVKLVNAVARRGVDVELRIVGQIDEPSLEEELKQATTRVEAGAKVLVIGHVSHDEALAEVEQAAVGLCLLHDTPTYRESIPTKLLEYMAAGVPVVASNFPAWRQYVASTGGGILVDSQETEAAADAVVNLLRDSSLRNDMGMNGRLAVINGYCWEVERTSLLELYRELAEECEGDGGDVRPDILAATSPCIRETRATKTLAGPSRS